MQCSELRHCCGRRRDFEFGERGFRRYHFGRNDGGFQNLKNDFLGYDNLGFLEVHRRNDLRHDVLDDTLSDRCSNLWLLDAHLNGSGSNFPPRLVVRARPFGDRQSDGLSWCWKIREDRNGQRLGRDRRNRFGNDRLGNDRLGNDRLGNDWLGNDRLFGIDCFVNDFINHWRCCPEPMMNAG